MAKWWHTALMMVGVALAMAGVALFIPMADYDYKFAIKTVEDSPPNRVVDVRPYDGLSGEEQEVFDRAREGETVRFEDRNPMPQVVRYEGRYYVAEAPRYIDWTDPRTLGPTGLFLAGGVVAVHAVRLDVRTAATL